MRTLTAVATALAAALLASPAGAATVTGANVIEPGGPKGPDVTLLNLTLTGDPGEASALTVAGSGADVTITDAAAPLLAAGTCVQVTPTQVTCPGAQGQKLNAQLGDGNDQLDLATAPFALVAVVNAGPGDDTVSGGRGPGSFNGGGGRDTLTGGTSSDSFVDGDVSGAADADVINGGPSSEDRISYATRTAGVTVDVTDPGTAGEAGEGDLLSGIESIETGTGDDRLVGSDLSDFLDAGPAGDDVVEGREGDDFLVIAGGLAVGGTGSDSVSCNGACRALGGPGRDDITGSDGDDVIRGGPGQDELLGLGGDDDLEGGAGNDLVGGGLAEGLSGDGPDGRDRITGGAGNDRLIDSSGADTFFGGSGRDVVIALDGRRETVVCGSGRDRLIADRRDGRKGCERRQVGAHVKLGSVFLFDQDRKLNVELTCPGYARGACRGRLSVSLDGVLVGHVGYRANGVGDADVPVSGVHKGSRVVITARGGDAAGRGNTATRAYRLRR
jgi:Ca2+-binding RTX toxin-like protein